MAGELKLTVALSYAKDGSSLDLGVTRQAIDVTGSNLVHHRQSIGLVSETLDIGEANYGGWLVAVNRDGTNYIDLSSFSSQTATPTMRLQPGAACAFRWHPLMVALYAVADTAACELEYWLVEA